MPDGDKREDIMVEVHVSLNDIDEISRGNADWRTVVMETVKCGHFAILDKGGRHAK